MWNSTELAVIEKLNEIEERENVRILLAVESGSRAWGFASPDSDYDARFIYVRTKEDYLRLNRKRDVIELPIDEVFDVNGWDVEKALKLLHGCNPTLFEWFQSPIVYKKRDESDKFAEALQEFFSPYKSLHHYFSMANGKLDVVHGERLKAKKYFYVLRPILACKWIMRDGTIPPIRFCDLVDSCLPAELRPEVDRLLDIKMNAPESELIPPSVAVNSFIDANMNEILTTLQNMEMDPTGDWNRLDSLFLDLINSVWQE